MGREAGIGQTVGMISGSNNQRRSTEDDTVPWLIPGGLYEAAL
jgi:hypothetical protein